MDKLHSKGKSHVLLKMSLILPELEGIYVMTELHALAKATARARRENKGKLINRYIDLIDTIEAHANVKDFTNDCALLAAYSRVLFKKYPIVTWPP